MKIIGITGMSGAGKTTVSEQISKSKNAKQINADKIAKELIKKGSKYYDEIVEEFGKEILQEDYEVNRKKLANIVFTDKDSKEKLDRLTYKHVVPKIKEEVEKNTDCDLIIIDAPLLFESGLNEICDITIGVIAEKKTCIDRIVKRDGINQDLACNRLDSQHNSNFFKMQCDYCVYNQNNSNIQAQISDILEGKNLSNKNVIHVYHEGFEYLQFRKLLEYQDKLKHCYTLKPLDVSNFELERDKVINSYKHVCNFLGLDEKNIYKPIQSHTDIVKIVENQEPGIHKKEFQDVDGLITDKKEKILSLSFADCNCLYFYDPVKNVIGNIHSGWRGTLKEISREAVKILKEKYKTNPHDLICIIAPSIRKCCFEVDENVKNMFYDKFKNNERIDEIIQKSKTVGKYHIDTQMINRVILEEEGLLLENIIESEICTSCHHDKLHSYRYEGETAGRNTSVICLV